MAYLGAVEPSAPSDYDRHAFGKLLSLAEELRAISQPL